MEQGVDSQQAAADRAARFPVSPRLRTARVLYALAAFAVTACLVGTPWGLTPAAVLTAVAVLLAPERILAALSDTPREVKVLAGTALLVALVVAASVLLHHDDWREAATRLRVVCLPLAAVLVLALQPPRAALWSGAVVGLFLAAAAAAWQVATGEPRAHGWTNAIVFADMITLLVAVAVWLRPSGRLGITFLALCCGLVAIGLSGSRGAWPAVVVTVGCALWLRWGESSVRERWALLLVAAALSVLMLPQVQQRVDALRSDVTQLARGDADTSAGGRMELAATAVQTVRAHPWEGVGVGHFQRALDARPECAARPRAEWCDLGHAHNDLLDWAGTMGLAGALALLALYGVPGWLFLRRLRVRPFPRRTRSAAMAGFMVVLSFALCGLTQSMWAHQVSGSTYLVLVGMLLGFSLREDPHKA